MQQIEQYMTEAISIPCLGCGTWQITDRDEMIMMVSEAFSRGYCLFDLAAAYCNEIAFHKAMTENGISRGKILLSDKVWNTSRGYDAVREACKRSLHKLKTDYIDFYLVHWPASPKLDKDWKTVNADTWRGMESLVSDGLVRAIGVCNFMVRHLNELKKTATIQPVLNQFEFHPGYWQKDVYDYCKSEHIMVMASSPLGNGQILNHPELNRIAETKHKSPAQICLRWARQKNVVSIPKTTNPQHLNENADIFNFCLTEEEMSIIDAIPFCGGLAINSDEVTAFD